MSDVYTEDADAQYPPVSTAELLSAEVDRTLSQAADMVRTARSAVAATAHDARARIVTEARARTRHVERKIQSQLALSALIALGTGLVLGVIAAAVSERSRRPPRT